jgi:kanosamine 6-kinase
MAAGHLGIDVGGTKVALRLVPVDGAPREAVLRWSRGVPATADLRDLATAVADLCAGWQGEVYAVGVAMPATVDPSGRVTTWPSRPSWTGLDLGSALRDLVPGARVAVGDDGDLAALAEADHAGSPDLAYIGVGTGIGGGIVLDGRICPGPARGSCEIGHLIVQLDGPSCVCGRRGCLQAIASGPATLRRATELRAGGERVPEDGPAEVSYDELRASWLAGAGWARAAIATTARAIAATVVSLTELVRPDVVVVGGGFADGLAGFADAVADHARTLARPAHPPAPVRPATLGGLSSLSGAVLLARGLCEVPSTAP